nr:uncharacterized protein LOC109185007 [Ipomoea trifida]
MLKEISYMAGRCLGELHVYVTLEVNVAPEIPNVAAFGAYEQYADFSDFGASIGPNYYTSGDTSAGTPLPTASHPAKSPESTELEPEEILSQSSKGVYDNWNEAKAQVHRFSDNLYKSFASKEKAIQAFDNFVANQMGSSLNAGASSCSSQTTNTARTTSNSDEVKLPDAQGDDGNRQPSDDKIGLDELSGCRALLIDVVEFCSHPGSLIFFIYDTPTDNDEVEVIYGNLVVHFNNSDPNYNQSYDALEHLLEYSVHVPTMNYLVFFNCQPGRIYTLILDFCELERISGNLFNYYITDSVFVNEDM